jgi:tyrosine-protein kinase Etk/Wzc
VDTNLAKPGIAGCLGLAEGPGVRELVSGSVALEEALRETDQESLWAVTAGGEVLRDEASMPSAEELGSLLATLRSRLDLVLVDGPVWRDTQDVSVIAAACDAVYLLLPQVESDQATTRELVRAIRRRTRRLSGMVLTRP